MNQASFSEESLAEPPAVAEPAFCLPWHERRDWFREQLQQHPLAGIGPDEAAAHFDGMPDQYWASVSLQDLIWGLETIHGFLRLVAAPNVPATTPFIDWRHLASRGHTRIMLCTWDRHGLLAKAAGVLSAVRLNILEADVFTRADNVVLDVFCVADAEGRSSASPKRLEEMKFLLEGALSEPPRFASVWACSRHKYLGRGAHLPPRIAFDNESAGSTLVQVEAPDRLGLLYDILQTIADSGLNITQARIETEENLAHDVFHVMDEHGQKVSELLRLEELGRRLETALTKTE
jgi:[protein-PII] uridylyltransferase